MLGLLLLCSTLGASQDPPPSPPSDAAALADYNGRRDKTPDTAAAQWKLALWCEQAGLKPEAYVHFGRVIEIDPRRDEAWRKLGFKKHDGRWMDDRQIAAEAERKKADATWAPRLKTWHKAIHDRKKPDPRKRDEAQAALDRITDPRAIPAIYREFGGGGAADQAVAVQLLGQVESPLASKALAFLAVYGKSPTVRRLATETLRGRPAGDYLDLLVGMMKDPLRFEVRPVGGPGSPGVLFVEGERFNVQRFYAPPAVTTVNPRPGDMIGYDANGLPVLVRNTTTILWGGPKVGVPGSKTLATEYDAGITTTEIYSFANAMIEAQSRAVAAQSQLDADVARIEGINEQRRKFTDLVAAVARSATGKDPGNTAKEWRDSLAIQDDRYARQARPKRTLDVMVPLDYVPNVAAITRRSELGLITQTVVDS